jgi:AraC-like DNA-binding protein
MGGRFTVLEVGDPHLIGQSVWEQLPPSEQALAHERQFSSWEWAALDQRHYRIEPESYRTESSVANIGRLRAGRVSESRATQFRTRPPVAEAVWLTVVERGAGRLVLPGSDEPIIGDVATGVIRCAGAGHWAGWSDGNIRLNLWLPIGGLRQKLAILLDGPQIETVEFQPSFDQTRGAGATIRRMLGFLFAELEHSDSLLTNEIAIQSFEEHLTLGLLLGLPHSHSERLFQQRTTAAPANVKRAEQFMRANAREPLTIEAIANAAGCSVRSLQLAFRRFRGTTPIAALQHIRLEAARAEMMRIEQRQSLARIAAEHGFANPSRFAQLFRRTYGTYPSEVLRTKREPIIGAQDVKSRAPQSD